MFVPGNCAHLTSQFFTMYYSVNFHAIPTQDGHEPITLILCMTRSEVIANKVAGILSLLPNDPKSATLYTAIRNIVSSDDWSEFYNMLDLSIAYHFGLSVSSVDSLEPELSN